MDKKLRKLINKIKRKPFIRFPLGALCILIGIISGFIPILQGWMFILVGLILLFGEENIKKLGKKLRNSEKIKKMLIICILSCLIILLISLIFLNSTRILQNEYCWETERGRYDYFRGDSFCVFVNRSGSVQKALFDEKGFTKWVTLNKK